MVLGATSAKRGNARHLGEDIETVVRALPHKERIFSQRITIGVASTTSKCMSKDHWNEWRFFSDVLPGEFAVRIAPNSGPPIADVRFRSANGRFNVGSGHCDGDRRRPNLTQIGHRAITEQPPGLVPAMMQFRKGIETLRQFVSD